MKLNFHQWIAINEIFKLDHGRVLSLFEAFNPQSIAQNRIRAAREKYEPGPYNNDHIASVVAGLKPAAIIRYDHHPESPAAAFVADELKRNSKDIGAIQAELLKHGFKVRPDFNIIHMNLPGYSTTNIIIGGKEATEELWQLYKCQYYLDFASEGDDDTTIRPERMQQANKYLQGTCKAFCSPGSAGMNCKPLHKRIGQLLGYTDAQVDEFIASMKGYDHIPKIHYPFELPNSLKNQFGFV